MFQELKATSPPLSTQQRRRQYVVITQIVAAAFILTKDSEAFSARQRDIVAYKGPQKDNSPNQGVSNWQLLEIQSINIRKSDWWICRNTQLAVKPESTIFQRGRAGRPPWQLTADTSAMHSSLNKLFTRLVLQELHDNK